MPHLDTTDPAHLEAALEATQTGALARVTGDDGVTHTLHRVPGGWYLPGDLAVTSGDVADGRPRAVEVLPDPLGEDPYDERDAR